MAVISRTLLVLAVLAAGAVPGKAEAQIARPFPLGYGMATFGALEWGQGMAARQPWTPSCFLVDSIRFGLAATGVDYFDRMDNATDKGLFHGAIGGFWSAGAIAVKGAWEELNAFGVYYEQNGFLSVGTRVIPLVSVSAEFNGFRSGLSAGNERPETAAELGASVWLQRPYAGLSLRVEHLTVKMPHADGLTADPTVAMGLATAHTGIGSQGVLATVRFGRVRRVGFSFAEEYWFVPLVGAHAGVATDPFMIAFGMVLALKRGSASVALVDHPVLGWSKGFEFEWFEPSSR